MSLFDYRDVDLTVYTYNDASRLVVAQVHAGILMQEIEASPLHASKRLSNVEYDANNDTLRVEFERPLSEPTERAQLDALVAAHHWRETDETLHWIVQDVKSTGSNGGTAREGVWQTRTLNSLSGSGADNCTLQNDRMILKRGTYKVTASVPAYGVETHRARLYNVSRNATAHYGPTQHANGVDDGDDDSSGGNNGNGNGNNKKNSTSISVQTFAALKGLVSVTEDSEQFEMQHYCSNSHESSGLGRAQGLSGVPEIYTTVEVEQL